METELNKKAYLEDYLRVQQYVCGAFLRHVDVIRVTMDSRLPFYTTHSHDELEILFVTNGTANVIVDGNCFSAQKGDFVVFMPQTLHCVKPYNDQLAFTAFIVNPVVAWQGQITQNITQMLQIRRGEHSVKPLQIIDGITKMFPEQEKIELFARNNYVGWDNWGLEIPDSKIEIPTGIL